MSSLEIRSQNYRGIASNITGSQFTKANEQNDSGAGRVNADQDFEEEPDGRADLKMLKHDDPNHNKGAWREFHTNDGLKGLCSKKMNEEISVHIKQKKASLPKDAE